MRNTRGFTLIELLIVTAIIAIFSGLAFPSFSSAIKSNSITSQSASSRRLLQLARSEAIKRGTSIVVATENSDWTGQWNVFSEAAPADQHYDAGRDTLIFSLTPTAEVIEIKSESAALTFLPNGMLSASNEQYIAFCDPSGQLPGILLGASKTGRIDTTAVPDAADTCSG